MTPGRRRAEPRLAAALLAGTLAVLAGCATPYVKSHQLYFTGDAGGAETVLAPVADKELKKDGNMKNLYMWDLGLYQFSQGKYEEAIESFKHSVADRERLYSTGQTITTVAFKSAASSKYLGDPVEVSVAYLYMGFAFTILGDQENAMVAFRRSTEEDLNKDPGLVGDMGITNYMMGECYLRAKQYDNAIVAFRRAATHAPDLVPAYVGIYHAARENNDRNALDFARQGLEKRVGAAYMQQVETHAGQGITVVLAGDLPDNVSKDVLTGMFRQRNEIASPIQHWELRAEDHDKLLLAQADHMHTHFKDQGGLGGEATRQVAKAAVGEAMKMAGCGILAPSTEADVRYWMTMPGRFYVGYAPAAEGTYSVAVQAYDGRSRPLPALAQEWTGVPVAKGRRTILVANSYVKTTTAQLLGGS